MRNRSILVFALWALAVPIGAQAPKAEEPRTVEVFEEAINVRVVNLEAVVIDRKGQRIPGLSAGDFRLRVDDVTTPLTYFAEIDSKAKQGPPPAETATVPPLNFAPDLSAPLPAPSWQNRNILVFLDEATMLKARRNAVLHAMNRQLEELAPGDRMAVVAFDGSRLEMLSDWTGDRARLAAVFAAVKKRPAQGIRQEVSRREEANDASFAGSVGGAGGLLDSYGSQYLAGASGPSGANLSDSPGSFGSPGVQRGPLGQLSPPSASAQVPLRQLPTQLFNPLSRFLESGQAAAAAMRGMPAPEGRKMLMLLTEGFPEPFFARPVVQEANRLGYSLYPVDVKGLDTFQASNDVENAAPPVVAPEFISTELDRRTNYTLEAMAAATGGKAAIDSNRMKALDNLIADSASYYLLGFSPAWRGDDRRHRIELTLNRPGLAVRTRTHYTDASRQTRLSLEANATLLFGRSQKDQRLILTVGESASDKEAKTTSLSLGVPVESLAFFPVGNGYRAQAPVAMVALDARGKRLELPGTWIEVDVPQLPLQGTYVRVNFQIPVETRARRLVVTVHDALSGEALWAEAWLGPERPH